MLISVIRGQKQLFQMSAFFYKDIYIIDNPTNRYFAFINYRETVTTRLGRYIKKDN